VISSVSLDQLERLARAQTLWPARDTRGKRHHGVCSDERRQRRELGRRPQQPAGDRRWQCAQRVADTRPFAAEISASGSLRHGGPTICSASAFAQVRRECITDQAKVLPAIHT
jgi:hypothetical protein